MLEAILLAAANIKMKFFFAPHSTARAARERSRRGLLVIRGLRIQVNVVPSTEPFTLHAVLLYHRSMVILFLFHAEAGRALLTNWR